MCKADLKQFRKNGWTPVENDLIRQLYPDGGTDACAKVIPNRTAVAIQNQATKLGIGHSRRKLWTDEERAELHRTFPQGQSVCMAALPGRKWKAIQMMAQREGLLWAIPKPTRNPLNVAADAWRSAVNFEPMRWCA